MSLTDREAFKFGFLLRCADENLDDAQIQERMDFALTKQANFLTSLVGGAADMAGKLPGYGLLAALGGGAGRVRLPGPGVRERGRPGARRAHPSGRHRAVEQTLT